MLIIISHFAKNKGVTDYFIDYLERNKNPYYYLRHPFNFESLTHSELIIFNGQEKAILRKYKKINNSLLDIFRNFLLSLQISFLLRNKINKVISFGGINVIPFLMLRPIYGWRVYFLGVDYSRKRFNNFILNKIYFFFETLSCKHSDLTISVTKRQEDARKRYHGLAENKSVIIPNGIDSIIFLKDFSGFKKTAFLYLGSITAQHGIIDFIKYFYMKNQCGHKLYAIGVGESETELKHLIQKFSLQDRIRFLGSMNRETIIDFLNKTDERFFGLAPYSDKKSDHVYFGDSLKIKEYLNFNIPFITNKVAYVADDLKDFGIIYDDFEELSQKIKDLSDFSLNLERKQEAMAHYKWDVLFQTLDKLGVKF